MKAMVTAAATAGLALLAFLTLTVHSDGPIIVGVVDPPYQVSAWAYTDAYAPSMPIAVAAGALDEIQGDWWSSRDDGSLTSWSPPDFDSTAHASGLRVLATVTNYDTTFDPTIVDAILSSREKTDRQVKAIVDACVSQGYDGVDLDWENMLARDRDLFSAFVFQLAAALHAEGKILGIAVEAKTSEPGDWSSQRAQDWKALGKAVDEFQVMTYDDHGGWSKPGPVAPPVWMDSVIAFAETQVPADKIWMGVPFYGYDWSGPGARSVTWRQAHALLQSHVSTLVRTLSGEARFVYRAQRVRHVVYFQDSAAISAKLQVVLVDHPAIAGVAIWSMGGEDPAFWTLLHSSLK